MPRLVITKGGKLYEERDFTDADIITIGRAEINDVVLPDPSLGVSWYHAAIIRAPGPEGRYFIRDLSSLSSTRVGGEVVYQRLLQDGDKIEIVDYELLYNSRVVVEEEEEEDLELIVVKKKGKKKTENRGREVTEEITVLRTLEELLKKIKIPLVPKMREVVEELLSRARTGTTLGNLFEGLMEPVLRVLSADRGFVGLFWEGRKVPYYGMGIRGFTPKKGERIEIADSSFLERLRDRECIQEGTTLLVPILLQEEVVGFFCVSRKPSAAPFSPEDVDFLSFLGQLDATRTRTDTPRKKREKQEDDSFAILEWPVTMVGNRRQEVYRQIEEAVSPEVNVLVVGETGVGKELVVDAIHEQSSRSGPCLKINCATIPDTLAEAELFGYVPNSGIAGADPKGAPGKFELAHGGTLLLDEIQDLNLSIQAKLLRVLQEEGKVKKVWRIGGRAPVLVDVKVIAATSQNNLEKEIEEGRFRPELYFRFEKMIRVPPLERAKRRYSAVGSLFPGPVCQAISQKDSRNLPYGCKAVFRPLSMAGINGRAMCES